MLNERPADLNEAQWQAVNHQGGHLLIVAGPGTGKTHTLIHRIARTIPILEPHESLLAITFTNKAATQMKDRLMAFDVPLRQVTVGTFHAFCLGLLREYWDRTNCPKDFKVASAEDLQDIDKALRERVSFIKSTKLVIDPDEDFKQYQKNLRGRGLIDFDDILREALALLEDEEVAAKVRARYRYIFVDEYQDINVVQHAFLKALAGTSAQVCAIGDPQQSIYGFRGAAVSLFDRFTDDFSGAVKLYLNENYRATPNLISASRQVIAKEKDADDIELIARIYKEGRLVIHGAASDRMEADYVANQIEKIIGGLDMRSARGTGHSFGDIAVLYRLNAERFCLTQALDHVGIPYQVSAKKKRAEGYSDEEILGEYEEVLDYQAEKVSLMTIHAAKGLEFPIVFIIGCEEHILPLDIEGMASDAAEERRLFYVGMTRAKEALYLTHASKRQLYGQARQFAPSPFLADIEEELKAYENVRRPKARKAEADNGQMKLF